MVYKIGTTADLAQLPPMDQQVRRLVSILARVLTSEYGADRDVEASDGGYVLYADPGTSAEELKTYFDYSAACAETVECIPDTAPPVCVATYILNNEYVVVIIMSMADAPAEIINEI